MGDHAHLAKNLRNYIAGFSTNMNEVLEHFGFDNTISELEKAKLLFKVLERFKNVDLSPQKVSNTQMGTIFEELIRKFNEALDENPGEHFTPRDVVGSWSICCSRATRRGCASRARFSPYAIRVAERAGCSPSPRSTSRATAAPE